MLSHRSPSHYRYFTDADIDRLRRIASLRQVEKLNFAGIRRALAEQADPKPLRRPDPYDDRETAVGERLREMRRSKGFSLQQAAQASGLSQSFLSLLERGRTGISIARLRRLLQVYGTTIAELLEIPAERPDRVSRASHRRLIRNYFRGVTMEQLVEGRTLMDPQIFHIDPGAGSEGSYSHEGEEFIYVLEGSFEVSLEGGERYLLRPGDSLYYPSTMEHSWRNPGPDIARVLWVNSPRTF